VQRCRGERDDAEVRDDAEMQVQVQRRCRIRRCRISGGAGGVGQGIGIVAADL
jgi:hypothetical protein